MTEDNDILDKIAEEIGVIVEKYHISILQPCRTYGQA